MTTTIQREYLPEPGDRAIALGPQGPFPNLPLTRILERRCLHYSFLSHNHELGMVANISWLGAAPEKPDLACSTAILLVYRRGDGWRASQFNATTSMPPWSSFRLPHAFGEPQEFEMAASVGTPRVRLRLERSSYPCHSQCATFTPQQYLRWQAETGVVACGDWEFDNQIYRDIEAGGCHERVCGYWNWSDLGGWVSGFASSCHFSGSAPPATSVVFNLVQPANSLDATTGSVMLWRSGHLRRHFPRRNINVAVRGYLDKDCVCQVPALANLLGVPPTVPIPRRLMLTARMGSDRVIIDFCAESAARMVVPCETSLVPFSVHEVIGSFCVEGSINGEFFSFETYGMVRFAGGACDD
jgi:hypothetical protein